MQYGQIEGVDKPISRLFLGTATIPENTDTNEWLTSIVTTGVNALDTARVYPGSEETIGRWLAKSGMREKVVLLSKCCHPLGPVKRVCPRAVKHDIKKSLKMLQTDYIDIYLLHRDDPRTRVGDIVEVFNELKATGKIRAFGASNWTIQRIEEANEYAYKKDLIPFSISSPSFSLAAQTGVFGDKTCVTISGPDNADSRDWYSKSQMPILAYAPLGHGMLSGRLTSDNLQDIGRYIDHFGKIAFAHPDNYERLKRCETVANKRGVSVPQIALAWLFAHKMDLYAVVSTKNPSRMEENARALEMTLSDEECRYLDLLED